MNAVELRAACVNCSHYVAREASTARELGTGSGKCNITSLPVLVEEWCSDHRPVEEVR